MKFSVKYQLSEVLNYRLEILLSMGRTFVVLVVFVSSQPFQLVASSECVNKRYLSYT